MLTPAKIKNHHFEAAGRNAYKAESVDAFFEEVADSYEQMFRENGEMFKKINLLAQRIEDYRNEEDSIRTTLLTAQRMADKISKEAEDKANSVVAYATEKARLEREKAAKEAEELAVKSANQAKAIVEEAQSMRDKLIGEAQNDALAAAAAAKEKKENEELALEAMQREVADFKAMVTEAYTKQLELIAKLPDIVKSKLEELPKEIQEPVVTAEAEAEEETETQEEPGVEEEPVVEEPVAEAAEIETEEPKAIPVSQPRVQVKPEPVAEEEPIEDAVSEEDLSEEESEDSATVAPIEEEEDDISDEVLSKLVSDYTSGVSRDEDDEIKDPFVEEKSSQDKDTNFKVDFDSITSYTSDNYLDDDDDVVYDDEDDDEDDEDDEDEDNGGNLGSKFKGFFKK